MAGELSHIAVEQARRPAAARADTYTRDGPDSNASSDRLEAPGRAALSAAGLLRLQGAAGNGR